MSIFSSAPIRRSLLTAAVASLALSTAPGLAQSFSPSVNGQYDITIPKPDRATAVKPLRTGQTLTFSPSTNGQVSVTVPVTASDDVRLANRLPN